MVYSLLSELGGKISFMKRALSSRQFPPEAIRPGEPSNRLSRGAAYIQAYLPKNQDDTRPRAPRWEDGGPYTARDKVIELAHELHND